MCRTRTLAPHWMLACLLVGLPIFGGATAATDLCGTPIETNVELQEDLSCAGDGLTIVADGIRLNLNGHTIAGSGSGVGVTVIGRTNVTISGGKITNFTAAVRVNTSTAVVIKSTEFRDNVDGVDLQAGSRGNTIKDNEFYNQRTRGVMLRGDTHNNEVKDNTFTGDRVGIFVNGAIDSTVKDNLFSGHSVAGIRVGPTATGNVIKANAVTSSAVGIDFVPSATGAAVGNTFIENTLALNTCGLKGVYGGNVFKETVFEGNGADVCP
jgi:parallel beta-helix repeat protein